MSRQSLSFLVVLSAAVALGGCRHRAPSPASASAAARLAALAMLPGEAEMIFFFDLDRLRGQPIWRVLSPTVGKHAGAALDEIAAGAGLEVMKQLHRVWVALPGERQADGRFALLADTATLDTTRVATWMQKRAREDLSVRMPNPNQILIAAGSWREAVNGSAVSRRATSAADNDELRRLCDRIAGEHGAWFAAVVPVSLRQTLMDAGRLSDVAALVRVFGVVNDGAGVHAELVGEFANTADPQQVAHGLKVFQNQAKRNPDMLVAGLSPYLESVRVEARNAQVRLTVDLPDEQTADVIERIEALARSTRTKYSPAP